MVWIYTILGRFPYAQQGFECKGLQHLKKREPENEMDRQ